MPPLTPAVSPLEQRLREFWAAFDAKDYQALAAILTDDALETDDLAKRWMCGSTVIREHFAQIGQRYEESHTALEDVTATETSATTGVVTSEVRYQMLWDGKPFTVDAPTTAIFVRQAGTWKIAVLHTR